MDAFVNALRALKDIMELVVQVVMVQRAMDLVGK
jgi:hypothetical protein